eukprot:365559-Chlamydomonas_euryale.AAC.1
MAVRACRRGPAPRWHASAEPQARRARARQQQPPSPAMIQRAECRRRPSAHAHGLRQAVARGGWEQE